MAEAMKDLVAAIRPGMVYGQSPQIINSPKADIGIAKELVRTMNNRQSSLILCFVLYLSHYGYFLYDAVNRQSPVLSLILCCVNRQSPVSSLILCCVNRQCPVLSLILCCVNRQSPVLSLILCCVNLQSL